MNTKLLMVSSALIMGITGIVLTFLPQETAKFFGWPASSAIAIQVIGALYFGFAMTNWIAKSHLIGGIYGRPVLIGNISHYIIAALALVKFSIKGASGITILIVTVIYSVFAISFVYLFFANPLKGVHDPIPFKK